MQRNIATDKIHHHLCQKNSLVKLTTKRYTDICFDLHRSTAKAIRNKGQLSYAIRKAVRKPKQKGREDPDDDQIETVKENAKKCSGCI
jgi:hypothetical protein